MPAATTTTTRHTLRYFSHDDVCELVHFVPQPNGKVLVIDDAPLDRREWHWPAEKARAYWRQLVAVGYERIEEYAE